MLIKVSTVLHFDLTKRAQAEALRDQLIPLLTKASVINEGAANEERGFIEVEKCLHDEGGACEVLGRWEVGRGKVI